MIYTELKAGEKIKTQAQGLISLGYLWIGMFIGICYFRRNVQ